VNVLDRQSTVHVHVHVLVLILLWGDCSPLGNSLEGDYTLYSLATVRRLIVAVPQNFEKLFEILKHCIDFLLGIPGPAPQRVHLLLKLMPKKRQFLPVMLQALPAFLGIARLPDPLNHLLQMVFNIVLDPIDLYDVLPEVVVLNICDLRVLVPFLREVEQMVRLHLLDDLHQPVVEGSGEVHLLLVLLLQRGKTVDVRAVLGYTAAAQPQNLHYLLVNRLLLILRVVRKVVSLADPQPHRLKPHHFAPPRRQLRRAPPAVKLLLLSLARRKLRPLVGVVHAETLVHLPVAQRIALVGHVCSTRADQRLGLQHLAVGPEWLKIYGLFLAENSFSWPRAHA